VLKTTFSFDDILLVPQFSEIRSRKEVDLSSAVGGKDFALPIISSPMDTVTGPNMALSMTESGGFGIFHRYNTIEEQVAMLNKVPGNTSGAAIGVTGDFLERADAAVEAGAFLLCVDVAHGHHVSVKTALLKLKEKLDKNITIMAGNVATAEAFSDLEDWGADIIRVGVGGGSICSTRIQTGHGVPTMHSVGLSSRVARRALIVADGGIKTAGDAVKCFAAGADFVMLGSLLAGTPETPGQIFTNNEGNKYKVYRGMASPEAQIDWKGKANSLEGISTTIPIKGPVRGVLSLLEKNIRSGLSYSGARNLQEFRNKVKMVRQTQAGASESFTHILSR
jgi:IMP dehydrogenase